MKLLIFALTLASLGWADGPGVIRSRRARTDAAPAADPASEFWKGVPGVFAERGPRGEAVSGRPTEIRSRWTRDNLYFLFICPYETLYLKPNPVTDAETNGLWDWDVAEVFVGWDFENIRRYKEFEVSPQGEWVDLDIDRGNPKGGTNWRWDSGFASKARIDRAAKVWYAEMRIPLDKIDTRPARAGNQMRVNLYRIEGGPPSRKFIAWQPTGSPSYHVPEAFGRLEMVE